jgi:hypothetical protein
MDICFYEIDYFDHPVYRVVTSVLYSALSLTATILNSLILISIWKTPSLHNPSYILIANLALSDLLNGAIGEPLMVITNIAALGHFKNTFCYIWKSARAITYGTTSVSLQTLALISVDRLLAVRLKNRYRSVVTLKRVARMLIVLWVGSFSLSNLVFLNVEIERLKHLLFVVEMFMFILLSTVSVCYAMAFYSLKKITSSVSPGATSDEASNPSPNINVAIYRKSLKTMLLVFIVIMVFYIPYVCMAFASALSFNPEQPLHEKNQLLYMLLLTSELVMIANSTMNPLLYLWRMHDNREAVKSTVKRIVRQDHSQQDEQA